MSEGIQTVRRLIQMDIIHFIDIVSLVSMISTIFHYNTAQLIIGSHLTRLLCGCGLLLQTEHIAWSVGLFVGRSVGLSQS